MQSGIDGVLLQDLTILPTDGGPVLRMLRADSPLYKGFGELYFSEIEPGKIKAWKCHTVQTQHFAVPVGRIKVVLYDARKGSPTRNRMVEIMLGRPDQYQLLRIPPEIWYGFTALGDTPALICNCADLPHDPAEALRKEHDSPDIPYHW